MIKSPNTTTGGSEVPGGAQSQQEVQVSSSPASISSTQASPSTPNAGPATITASQAQVARTLLNSSAGASGGLPHVQSGIPNGPLNRCDAIYAEIQRLNALRTWPAQQKPAAAVRQAQEERVKELYAELSEAGKARLPSRKPDWACSTKELYDLYPAFGFWQRGVITNSSFLVPVNLDNWLFPRNSVTPDHIWGLARWAGFNMSDGRAEAIWWKLIRECPRSEAESIGTWRERLWVFLRHYVAKAAAENREHVDRMEASQKSKRSAEDLDDGRDQRPPKKGKGEVGDLAVSKAKSSNLLGTSPNDPLATSAKSSNLSGIPNDGPRTTPAKSPKPSGTSHGNPRAPSAKSSRPSKTSKDGAQARLPIEAPYHIPVVPLQSDDDQPYHGSDWSNREARVLYSLLKARREYEKAHNAGKADQLRDVKLWDSMSAKLKAQNIIRTRGGCKMFWGRYGRVNFGYDERINPKNPGQLVSSAQISKKDKERNATAKEQMEADEGHDESEVGADYEG
jgi:hypothetical protein